jgi:hypothetical protein
MKIRMTTKQCSEAHALAKRCDQSLASYIDELTSRGEVRTLAYLIEEAKKSAAL